MSKKDVVVQVYMDNIRDTLDQRMSEKRARALAMMCYSAHNACPDSLVEAVQWAQDTYWENNGFYNLTPSEVDHLTADFTMVLYAALYRNVPMCMATRGPFRGYTA